MIYRLVFEGGPLDGKEMLTPHPYDAYSDDSDIYGADQEGEACLEWVDDDTRKITLKYLGRGVQFPPTRPSS